MKFYVAQTTYTGADAPTKRYFSTAEKAEEWLKEHSNGECYSDYDESIHVIPYEGCTGDDLRYWNE